MHCEARKDYCVSDRSAVLYVVLSPYVYMQMTARKFRRCIQRNDYRKFSLVDGAVPAEINVTVHSRAIGIRAISHDVDVRDAVFLRREQVKIIALIQLAPRCLKACGYQVVDRSAW